MKIARKNHLGGKDKTTTEEKRETQNINERDKIINLIIICKRKIFAQCSCQKEIVYKQFVLTFVFTANLFNTGKQTK